LTDHYRNTIEKAFNCKVVDCYGSRDGGVMAYEIKKRIYLANYSSILERINDEKTNETFLVTTDLFNYSSPFIRYKNGDDVIIDNSGLNWNGQVINKVYGRTSDIIYLRNGNVLTGPGFTVLFQNKNVVSYQIIKLNDRKIRCIIVKNKNFSIDDEHKIRIAIEKQAGLGIDVEILYTDKLDVKNNGKSNYFLV
jgi:phenylacetate-CoA ligase